MEIPLFLAMTAAEFRTAEVLPPRTAWMACHFSAYGTGLSNVPQTLPPASMLMLNDRTPICGHDPKLVAQILCETAKNLECDRILLDFQRADYSELFDVVETVFAQASCPVGVSSLYAGEFDCPVLVPPIPPHILPEDVLSIWKGREIWLELSTDGTEITVTKDGSRYTPLPGFVPNDQVHQETELYCHYEITVEEDQVLFQIGRTNEDREALLEVVGSMGVSCALGLWLELWKNYIQNGEPHL